MNDNKESNINKKTESEIEILTDFTIVNISEGGILTETNTNLNVDSIHLLKLPYKELTIKGLVKRVELERKNDEEIYKIAFQFIEITSQQKELLRDFINSIKREQKNTI
jgi:c-di-GMP-binding flagellar brake protein YcgR